MPTKKTKTPQQSSEEVQNIDLSQLKEDKAFDPDTALVDPGDRTLSAVGYLSILCILPLILRPKSDFCQFHGKQGLAVLLAYIPFTIFARFIDVIAGMPIGMGTFSFLFFLIQLYGAWRAWSGHKDKIPPFSIIVDKYLQWEDKVKDEIEIPEDME